MKNSTAQRNIIILENIDDLMYEFLNKNDLADFIPMAQNLAVVLEAFADVVKCHTEIPFAYGDVLKDELSVYSSHNISILDNFGNHLLLEQLIIISITW